MNRRYIENKVKTVGDSVNGMTYSGPSVELSGEPAPTLPDNGKYIVYFDSNLGRLVQVNTLTGLEEVAP